MYGDKILKLINKTLDRFEFKDQSCNPPFEIPKKALIVLPPYIGDIILLTPLIRNLRYNFGEKTTIDVICTGNIKNLLETLPYIDNIFCMNLDIKDKANFLKGKAYDTAFLFNYPVLWAIACKQTKVPQRISFNLERIGLNNLSLWQSVITHLVKSTPIDDKNPQWQVYLNVIRELNLNYHDEHTEIILTEKDIKKAEKLVKSIKTPKILIQVIAGSIGKQLELDKWVVILKYLKKKYDCSILSTGIKSEKEVYDYLSSQSGVEIYNLCGKTTLRETIALYQHLDMVITIDTAVAHLAGVAKTRNIVIIYGPTNESQWLPYAPDSNIQQVHLDLPCRPCITRFCTHKNCLAQLSPQKIIKTIDKIKL